MKWARTLVNRSRAIASPTCATISPNSELLKRGGPDDPRLGLSRAVRRSDREALGPQTTIVLRRIFQRQSGTLFLWETFDNFSAPRSAGRKCNLHSMSMLRPRIVVRPKTTARHFHSRASPTNSTDSITDSHPRRGLIPVSETSQLRGSSRRGGNKTRPNIDFWGLLW